MEEKQACKKYVPDTEISNDIYRNMMYFSRHLNTGNKVFI